ncbi:hypothetical protein [Actinacidiphila acididurans]|uniref:Resolvase/invertase-type recombinase catalytic domain-containing protein n=1 Tax=Actinacidiphila acididurans TaxID=2784346 RepID=A0ABS2TWU4_9ACTN|nr:hypothetical protein [Actinacidiphila acididurans]MBM9507809.1 hypothetical protein [Actinacidiphila acididurans]
MEQPPDRHAAPSRVFDPCSSSDPIAAVAYLRRLPGMDKETVQRAIEELGALATRRGFGLAGVHFERRPSERLDTWAELIVGCCSEGVVNVLVPNAAHFHQDPAVAAFMREELAEKVRGTVWYASELVRTSASSSGEAGRHDH